MARSFNGTSQFLSSSSTPGDYTTQAFSGHAWIYPTDLTVAGMIFCRGSFGTHGWYFDTTDGAAANLGLIHSSGLLCQSAASTLSNNIWQSVGFSRSGSAVKLYINGVEPSYKQNDSFSDFSSSTNPFLIAGYNLGSGSNWFPGRVGDAALWHSALTAAQFKSLAAGFSPAMISPNTLDNYWPLLGVTSPEIDLVGGKALTLNSAPPAAVHAAIIYPRRHRAVFVPSAAASFKAAWAGRSNQMLSGGYFS